MAGDAVAEVLDLKAALEAAGKESAEWGDDGCEHRQDQRVKLHRTTGVSEFRGRRLSLHRVAPSDSPYQN